MAKKRKSENAGLDEVERTLYTSFCTAANSISHLYTQAQHQQKLAFQAGERHSVEKLYQWLQREHQAGSNITTVEIMNYLQNELDFGDEMTMSPGNQFQHQVPPQQEQSNSQAPPGVVGYSGISQVQRMGTPTDQSKISVFTGALSSPNRRCLPPFAVVQSSYGTVNSGNFHSGRRSGGGMDQHHDILREDQEDPPSPSEAYNSTSPAYGYNPQGQHGRDHHGFGENDASMDMHADGVSDDYYQ